MAVIFGPAAGGVSDAPCPACGAPVRWLFRLADGTLWPNVIAYQGGRLFLAFREAPHVAVI